jgi:hypothetical protein
LAFTLSGETIALPNIRTFDLNVMSDVIHISLREPVIEKKGEGE